MVQMTMVSRKTSMTPSRPCWAGWATLAAACAMDAVPMPASLVNTPREMPVLMTPVRDPTAALGRNASRKTEAKAPGMASTRRTRTSTARNR